MRDLWLFDGAYLGTLLLVGVFKRTMLLRLGAWIGNRNQLYRCTQCAHFFSLTRQQFLKQRGIRCPACAFPFLFAEDREPTRKNLE
jgi:DNA-directed RNA polymerase subunit RPC12/RpoP